MKNLYMLLILILIAWLSLTQLSSCQEEDVLPPITMEGKHTFGCLVNGELWLPEKKAPHSSPINADATSSKVLSFGASSNKSSFLFVLNRPIRINNYYFLSEDTNVSVYHSVLINDIVCSYEDYHVIKGNLNVSVFDLNANILSGTFEFTSYNPNCGDTVKITDGRFDIGRIAH